MKDTVRFEPKIIGFLCHWCSYAGADKAGGIQGSYPHNVKIIRLMCSGRVDPLFVLSAFEKGADGVIILACHHGDCHYKEGNCRALQRHSMLSLMLAQLGIEKERCRLDYVSAGEGEKFKRLISEMVESVSILGALQLNL
ncbi:MAG: hydrogenase iron-sulfur subunit [Desulfuromonadales bacterium]